MKKVVNIMRLELVTSAIAKKVFILLKNVVIFYIRSITIDIKNSNLEKLFLAFFFSV